MQFFFDKLIKKSIIEKIIYKNSKMIFLDTETTGFELNNLIELAYINSSDNSRFEKRYGLKWWIKIELEAMAIHHITEKMISGLEIFEESGDFKNLSELLKSEIMVCHNTKYDYDSVLWAVYWLEIPKRICTLKLAKRLLPNLPKHNLQYLRYYFELEFNEIIDPHAAISDVIVLEAVYNKLFEIAKNNFKDKTDEEIIEIFMKIEKNPVLLWRIDFWKHRWIAFKDLPKDYLEWLIKSDFDNEDVIYTAKYYLEK